MSTAEKKIESVFQRFDDLQAARDAKIHWQDGSEDEEIDDLQPADVEIPSVSVIVLSKVTGIELDRLMYVKLATGWTKKDVKKHLALAEKTISWREWYRRLTEIVSDFDIQNFPADSGINGAYVGAGKLEGLFKKLLDHYTKSAMWEFEDDDDECIVFVFWDGHFVFGKNELMAMRFKQVKHCQSPNNIFPISMAKWKGAEAFNKLKQIAEIAGLQEFIRKFNGKEIEIGERKFRLFFPVIVDWMSLIAGLNNTAPPASRESRYKDPCLCGLCGFKASDKAKGWRQACFFQWKRYLAENPEWNSVEHLLPLDPEFWIWEPLHLITRVLDTIVHYVLSHSRSEIAKQIRKQLKKAGRKWPDGDASAHSFILKEVRLYFHQFYIFHPLFADQKVF